MSSGVPSSDFESESENNKTFFPIEGPNDFMFNDFEIIGGEVSSEVKEVRSEPAADQMS